MNYLVNIIDKIATFLDKRLFSKNKTLRKISIYYFFITSHITAFFLFSKIGLAIITLYSCYVFFISVFAFKILIALAADFGFFFMVAHFWSILPKSILFLIFFYFFLLDLTFNNTLLVSCESIRLCIQENFGESFLKKQFYNNRLGSLIKVMEGGKILTYSLGGVVVAATVASVADSLVYGSNYEKYVDAQVNNPNVTLEAPRKGISGVNVGFFNK